MQYGMTGYANINLCWPPGRKWQGFLPLVGEVFICLNLASFWPFSPSSILYPFPPTWPSSGRRTAGKDSLTLWDSNCYFNWYTYPFYLNGYLCLLQWTRLPCALLIKYLNYHLPNKVSRLWVWDGYIPWKTLPKLLGCLRNPAVTVKN